MNSDDLAGVLAGSMFFICVALTFILRGPLGKALARRIESRAATDPEVEAELEQLRGRVASLEGQQTHLAELEERLDFAERLLIQQRAQPQPSSIGEQS